MQVLQDVVKPQSPGGTRLRHGWISRKCGIQYNSDLHAFQANNMLVYIHCAYYLTRALTT